MTLDPAMRASKLQTSFPSLSNIKISTDTIYAFDFDGVLASRTEDDIYKLLPFDEENLLIKAVADAYGIRCQDMHHQYQRHLVYQAAAWKLGLPIKRGSGFQLADEANRTAQFFILTARSGWYAVERFRQFIKTHRWMPVETYNIGRVPKDRQIELLAREFFPKRIAYVDDSDAQLELIAAMNIENVSLFAEKDTSQQLSVADLQKLLLDTLKESLT